MPDKRISYEIKEHIGVITKNKSGWNKELNLISWNGNNPRFDIRDWDEHHEKMSRGVTLSEWEMQKMVDIYLKRNSDIAVARGRALEEERRKRRQSNMEHEEALYGQHDSFDGAAEAGIPFVEDANPEHNHESLETPFERVDAETGEIVPNDEGESEETPF